MYEVLTCKGGSRCRKTRSKCMKLTCEPNEHRRASGLYNKRFEPSDPGKIAFGKPASIV